MTEFFPTLSRASRRAFTCFGRGMKKLGRALLYILPVLLLVHIAATLITGRMVRRELAALAEAGEPLTARELAPIVPPGEKNAADIYQRAFHALRLSEADSERLFGSRLDWEPESTPLAREVLVANAEYFKLLEEASQTPHCTFPVDWEAGFAATFPHFPEMRKAERMLRVRAEVLAVEGDIDGAIASYALAFRMAEHVKTEPTLIGQLVAYAMQDTNVGGLESALARGTPSPQAARKIFDQLAAVDQRGPFVRAMQGERTSGLLLFDLLRRGAPSETTRDLFGLWGLPLEGMARFSELIVEHTYRTLGRPLLNLDEVSYLRAWEAYGEAIELPWPQSREHGDAVQSAVEQLPLYRSILTKIVLPIFGEVPWTVERRTASVRAAQIALALAAYRAEQGSYPDSLVDLEASGWDLPADPFGGGPYHYRREGDGFVVWSIGPDMEDDNAARDLKDWQQLGADTRAEYDYDVIFRCSS